MQMPKANPFFFFNSPECDVFCLFCCFVQVTSSAQVSSSLQRGFWSMPAAWASPSSSGFSAEEFALWGHCATPNWASPSPNLGEITPTWQKSSEDWWGTRAFMSCCFFFEIVLETLYIQREPVSRFLQIYAFIIPECHRYHRRFYWNNLQQSLKW